jgi:antitoxin ParD1/3/4
MNIILDPQIEVLIQKQLISGKYANPNQVIEEALNLLEKRNQYDSWIEEIRDKIDIAATQLDQGLGIDGKIAIYQLLP